ncbi:MAG: hypothetical protein AB3N64_03935 [Puniceicoccaceae bacterium]
MLHKNPIFIRFCRSELRPKKAFFWYLLTLIGTAFAVAVTYAPQVAQGREAMAAARNALLPVMIIQGVILLFMGTGSIASGITREKVENVLDYQRLTPLATRDKIIGYLFGLPIRHYVMFSITLPFLLFILIVGQIPPSAFVPYYLVFFTSTLLYHFTGLVAGMISRKWRWSARISQGLIFLLYFVLPQLSHIGLVFLEFLTVRPVFAEKIIPVIGSNANISIQGMGFMAGQSVPLFHLTLSGTLFSFIIQAGLVVLFAGIVARKWKADSIPAISKKMALITFAAFSIMSLANIWPNLTRAENALNIFQSDGDLGAEIAVVVLPLIMALVTTYLAFVLMTSALPDPMQFRHGRIRAMRLGHDKLKPWEDAAGGYPFIAFILLIQVVFFGVVIYTLNQAGYYADIELNPLQGLWLLLGTALTLFYFQALKENFGTGLLAMFVLISWAVPILLAIVIFAVNQDQWPLALAVTGLSPIALIPFSVFQMAPVDEIQENFIYLQRALGVALLTMTGLNVWLHLRLRKLRKALPI